MSKQINLVCVFATQEFFKARLRAKGAFGASLREDQADAYERAWDAILEAPLSAMQVELPSEAPPGVSRGSAVLSYTWRADPGSAQWEEAELRHSRTAIFGLAAWISASLAAAPHQPHSAPQVPLLGAFDMGAWWNSAPGLDVAMTVAPLGRIAGDCTSCPVHLLSTGLPAVSLAVFVAVAAAIEIGSAKRALVGAKTSLPGATAEVMASSFGHRLRRSEIVHGRIAMLLWAPTLVEFAVDAITGGS